MNEDITDGEAPGEAGEAAQPLEAELASEEAAPLEPGPDVLTTQRLGLGHNLLDGDRPPPQRGAQLPGDRVTHVGEPGTETLMLLNDSDELTDLRYLLAASGMSWMSW